MINTGVIIANLKDTITISFDEKPGMQAISQTSKELRPVLKSNLLRGIMSTRGWARCLFWQE